MDGTICNIYTPFMKSLKEKPEIKYPQSQLNFFKDLEPIKDAVYSVNRLRDAFDVRFLTRPSTRNRHCYTEKADWIYEWFGQWGVDNLYICPDKTVMKGEWLIDDNLWEGFEGIQLLYGSIEYPDWNSIIDCFYEEGYLK